MTDFLEKLKKGMEIENPPENPPESEAAVLVASSEVKPEIKPAKKKRTAKKKIEVKSLKKENFSNEAFVRQAVSSFEPEGELTVDVFETEKELVVQSAVAGVEPKDLDIVLENDRLSIKGQRFKQSEESGENYFKRECHWGKFSREIILPVEADNSRAKATFKNGVLTIRVPKINREKKKKLSLEE